MRVLFVASGNSGDAGVIVRNQAESLRREGIVTEFFLIKGKGLKGYITGALNLRQHLKKNKYSLIHAHYGFSGIVASFCRPGPVVVSLMGSDIYSSRMICMLNRLFCRNVWDATIVKSPGMAERMNDCNVRIIPNGVDLQRFIPMDKGQARLRSGITEKKIIILFIADPSRREKNFKLANESVSILNRKDVELLPLYNAPNSEVPLYLNSADILLLTSLWEGSVNVVKEAMACNLPVVSVDTGDVRENISGIEGCYITGYDSHEIANAISKSLEFGGRSNGRERIMRKGLDSVSIAKKIISLYEEVLQGRN
jgi:glycosyltransferase involved in cell wall biosynthesis